MRGGTEAKKGWLPVFWSAGGPVGKKVPADITWRTKDLILPTSQPPSSFRNSRQKKHMIQNLDEIDENKIMAKDKICDEKCGGAACIKIEACII